MIDQRYSTASNRFFGFPAVTKLIKQVFSVSLSPLLFFYNKDSISEKDSTNKENSIDEVSKIV